MSKELYDHLANMTYRCYDHLKKYWHTILWQFITNIIFINGVLVAYILQITSVFVAISFENSLIYACVKTSIGKQALTYGNNLVIKLTTQT